MKEIITWVIISGAFLIVFLVAMLFGIIKKRISLVYFAVAAFLLAGASIIWTGYKMGKHLHSKLKANTKLRDGDEIYKALFGRTDTECVRVIQYQDQLVPRIDNAIYLHFETCPAEMKKILGQESYSSRKIGSNELMDNASDTQWFKPQNLGDSLYFFEWIKDDYRNVQYLYARLDSSEAYCKDTDD